MGRKGLWPPTLRCRWAHDEPLQRGFWEKRRPKHILTGLVVCGCCGHALAAVGQDYLRCARADRNGLCSNRKGIRHPVLEDLFIGSLQDNLMQPELVEEFIAAFHAEVNRNRGDAEHGRRRH
jgi:site-specific DNA recombinase